MNLKTCLQTLFWDILTQHTFANYSGMFWHMRCKQTNQSYHRTEIHIKLEESPTLVCDNSSCCPEERMCRRYVKSADCSVTLPDKSDRYWESQNGRSFLVIFPSFDARQTFSTMLVNFSMTCKRYLTLFKSHVWFYKIWKYVNQI